MTEMQSPFLDRVADIEVSYDGVLPHWHQQGKMQYVTFRLADSLPQTKITELNALKEDFEAKNPKPWDDHTTLVYQCLISAAIERMLDRRWGSCVLRHPDVRKHVEEKIEFFRGERYDIIAYVIMPNHVHLLLLMLNDYNVYEVVRSIKKFSAMSINREVFSAGRLWMRSHFDRMVRSEDHLKHCVNYIRNNPRHLPATDYTLYINRTRLDPYGNWLG